MVGSSSSSSSGAASRICASATRIFQPPDSVPTSCCDLLVGEARGRAGSTARAPRARSRRGPGSAPGPRRTARRPRRDRRRRFELRARARASSSPSSATSPAPAHGLGEDRCGRADRRRPGGSSRASACVGRSTAPSSGDSSPTISRNTVLLPAPLGPTSPTFSPGLIWNDASTNRIWPPYCLLTELNAITERGL